MGRQKGVPQRNGKDVARLPLGDLPATMRRQLKAARGYRRDLEKLTVAAKGCVSALDAHLINEAVTAECHSAVCRWLLRTKLETMAVADVAKCSGEILKGRTVRNRAVERLELNVKPEPMDLATYLGHCQLPVAAPETDQGEGRPEALPADDPGLAGANSATDGE
jgi:hypothetical protein